MKFNYRIGTILDLKALQNLCIDSYGQFRNVITNENWQSWEKSFRDENNFLNLLNIGKCFVCENENNIIGMAFMIPHGNPYKFFDAEWSYIRYVGVSPGFEGNGIGKKLTQLCIEDAKNMNEKIITLHTSEFHDAARHIYESLGFAVLKELEPMFGKKYYLYEFHLTDNKNL